MLCRCGRSSLIVRVAFGLFDLEAKWQGMETHYHISLCSSLPRAWVPSYLLLERNKTQTTLFYLAAGPPLRSTCRFSYPWK